MNLNGSLFGDDQPCFGCAPDHPFGFRLHFEVEKDEVKTLFMPTPQYQGPPGIMHGGLVMTLGDELAAWTLLGIKNRFGFTTKADVRLKKPIRIGQEVVGRGFISEDRRRIVDIQVRLSQEDRLCFEGCFVFAILGEKSAERLLKQRLPETWKQFTF